jgi:hypothetical protein
MFQAGQESGNAWADVLLGTANPSGKLPVTFPLHEHDLTPICWTSQCEYSESLSVGWRGLIDHPVAFPFGHGLSYTTFQYEWIQPPQFTDENANVTMSVQIRNVGVVKGAEVAQVYLNFPKAALEPEWVLRAFAKTKVLEPSESEEIKFTLSSRDLSIWGCDEETSSLTTTCKPSQVQRRRRYVDMCACRRRSFSERTPDRWRCNGDVVEPPCEAGWQLVRGSFKARVGSSSRDLRLSHNFTTALSRRLDILSTPSFLV